MTKSAGQASGKVEGVAPIPEQHYLFQYSAQTSAGKSYWVSKWVWLPGAQRVALKHLLWGQGASLVNRKIEGIVPTPKPHHSITDTSWVFPDLNTSIQVADSSSGHELRRGMQQKNPEGTVIAFTQADAHIERSALLKKDGVFGVGEWLSTSVLAAVFLSCLSRVTNPTLYSHDSSQLCPPFHTPAWVAMNKILCIDLFKGCLCLW